MTSDEIQAFLDAHQLPASFRRTHDLVCGPLATAAVALRERLGRTAVIGLCGAQGSGKSTIAAATVERIAAGGRCAAALSLDDLYLTQAERRGLAQQVHPLLAVRGPPGTHDVDLGLRLLDSLAAPGPTVLPRFDKAADDRSVVGQSVEGPADVVIFEGWCVGARPAPDGALKAPCNALERTDDASGVWRGFTNAALAGPYAQLFARIDALVLLQAPGFDIVTRWRGEQEARLRARTGRGMSEAEVVRFVGHYERITRRILEEMPARAAWVVRLDEARSATPRGPCQL